MTRTMPRSSRAAALRQPGRCGRPDLGELAVRECHPGRLQGRHQRRVGEVCLDLREAVAGPRDVALHDPVTTTHEPMDRQRVEVLVGDDGTHEGCLVHGRVPARDVDRLPLDGPRETRTRPRSTRRPWYAPAFLAPHPIPGPGTAPGTPRRAQTSVSSRPMQRPKNGWSSGAVRKSPSRVGRVSDVT